MPCISLSDPRVAVGGATAIWGGNILQTLQCVAVCCSVLQCVMTWDLKERRTTRGGNMLQTVANSLDCQVFCVMLLACTSLSYARAAALRATAV